jgi:type VI protein secretion system component VasF
MSHLIDVLKFVLAHAAEIQAAALNVLMGLIALFMLIPGEQPEKFLQKCVDFIKKFSRKGDDQNPPPPQA